MFNHEPWDFQIPKMLSPDLDRNGSGTLTFVDSRRRGLPYKSSNDGGSSSILGGGLVIYSVLRLIKMSVVAQHEERKANSLEQLHEKFVLNTRVFLVQWLDALLLICHTLLIKATSHDSDEPRTFGV
jgi:hypothetical protein